MASTTYSVGCSLSPKRRGSNRWVPQGTFKKYNAAAKKAAASARKYKRQNRAGVCVVGKTVRTQKGGKHKNIFSTGWFGAHKRKKRK